MTTPSAPPLNSQYPELPRSVYEKEMNQGSADSFDTLSPAFEDSYPGWVPVMPKWFKLSRSSTPKVQTRSTTPTPQKWKTVTPDPVDIRVNGMVSNWESTLFITNPILEERKRAASAKSLVTSSENVSVQPSTQSKPFLSYPDLTFPSRDIETVSESKMQSLANQFGQQRVVSDNDLYEHGSGYETLYTNVQFLPDPTRCELKVQAEHHYTHREQEKKGATNTEVQRWSLSRAIIETKGFNVGVGRPHVLRLGLMSGKNVILSFSTWEVKDRWYLALQRQV
ncbi:hypothetical protein BCR33DRAFT_716932 [Rhizoclosmatium globosum]|uniref:Uncharacterized protein n=1 Tax=Rhizoclosmatium globosum TaxID=329046 RepID=A0A1Y2CBH9_9FUNG|nr:hypothetical protein BCR33DRAFT_716932 [Rhizoclosmatium globosum]|eukprot:ORY44382.1 hypothetical protein BCR33DRAFT_716932 [Rhizoclosmatium globosum]